MGKKREHWYGKEIRKQDVEDEKGRRIGVLAKEKKETWMKDEYKRKELFKKGSRLRKKYQEERVKEAQESKRK